MSFDGVSLAVGDAYDREITLFDRDVAGWSQSALVDVYDGSFNGAVAINGDALLRSGYWGPSADISYVKSGADWVIDPMSSSFGWWTTPQNVAARGGIALVGPVPEDPSIGTGTVADVFRRVSGAWVLVGTVPMSASSDRGTSDCGLSVSGDEIAVTDQQNGSVGVYSVGSDSVTPEQIIDASAYRPAAVALDGDSLAVMAPDETSDSGVVHLYHRSAGTWAPEHQVEITSGLPVGMDYGFDLRNDRLAVGAPTAVVPSSGSGEGQVYVWERSGGAWPLALTIDSPARTTETLYGGVLLMPVQPLFGSSLALGDTQLFVGAQSEVDPSSMMVRGAAYGFDLTEPPANHAPVAQDASVTVSSGSSVVASLTATDADGDPLTYSIVSPPAHGTLTAVSGHNVTYTPDAGYHGSDSFTFKANDGQADSNVATESVSVTVAAPVPVVSTPASSSWSLALLAGLGLGVLGVSRWRWNGARNGV